MVRQHSKVALENSCMYDPTSMTPLVPVVRKIISSEHLTEAPEHLDQLRIQICRIPLLRVCTSTVVLLVFPLKVEAGRSTLSDRSFQNTSSFAHC